MTRALIGLLGLAIIVTALPACKPDHGESLAGNVAAHDDPVSLYDGGPADAEIDLNGYRKLRGYVRQYPALSPQIKTALISDDMVTYKELDEIDKAVVAIEDKRWATKSRAEHDRLVRQIKEAKA